MHRPDSNLHHVAIVGRRLSGKTTLLIEFLRASWERERRYGVVLDPKIGQHQWGTHCYVTADREKWLSKWQDRQCRNCNIVWEETSTTLKRDADYVDVFTAKAGAHGHRLIITCHTGAALLPVMRDQITEIFLFRQSRNEAEKWAEQFTNPHIVEVACSLNYDRREFIHVRMGQNDRPVPRVLNLNR